MSMFRITPILFLFFIFLHLPASNIHHIESQEPVTGRHFTPPPGYSTPWVDSVFSSLTLEQRIGQLFVVEVHSNMGQRYNERMGRMLIDNNIGGIVFFKGGPVSQLRLTNQWQRQVQTPMFITMDAEWGLSMRLDSTPVFPRQITLGAITNERLIYELGLELGWQFRRMGMHINFSPVADVNSNPRNPVINSRSFGESRYNVSRKSLAMMFGMQDAGILASAKHFPGHGDTDTDSHHTLPIIRHPRPELDSVHLFPFKHLIDQGLLSVMVAHLNIPSLDDTPKLPSSLSHKIVTELLQQEMGFNGLIITDALNMRGVSDYYPRGQLEVQALLAGNDILLMPENVPAAVNSIKRALENGTLPEAYFNEKVKKILFFKEKAGLHRWRPMPVTNVTADLNAARVQKLNKRLADAAITVIHNPTDILPLSRTDTMRIAALSIGSSTDNPYQAMLANYGPLQMFSLPKNHNAQQAQAMLRELSAYNLVLVSIQNNSMFPGRNYGINTQTIDFVNQLSKENNVVLNVFASPYSLQPFGEGLLNTRAIVVSYQDGRDFEEASAQVIFGALPARGRLPVSIVPWFPIYTGLNTPGGMRIRFQNPEDVGMSPDVLRRVDSIALMGIRERAFPGCQIAIIKDGAMVYNRSFGHHTYDKQTQVHNSDIYDLASLTKILATTSALMTLVDEDKIQLNKNLGDFLPLVKGSNKETLSMRDILAHQARLRSWIPFHLPSLLDGRPGPEVYRASVSDDFPIQVAERLFIHKSYRDTIFKALLDSELLNRKRYIYSDLGFILFAEMVEHITGMRIDSYMDERFFRPMGLQTLGYQPLLRENKQRIVPTELDTLFRGQQLQGYVHDPSAAMLGGVAGHAGLFGNAGDVAVFMQMFIQNGSYGGVQFIRPETLREFTRTQFAGNQNRRALGFDKPTIRAAESSPAARSASVQSFGHTGFTGTYAWADPAENLVFVFLSNRVHPDAANRKISQLSIRTEIHQVIYDAINAQRYLQTTRLH